MVDAERLPPGACPDGQHLVERLAAEGGFAHVYRARHLPTGAPVAFKVLRHHLTLDPNMLARFRREADALARLDHPGIVRIRARGELTDGRPWLAMEWIEGPPLDEELAARGPLVPREALALLSPIAEALDAVHAAGLVHRDLSGSNVMLRGGCPCLVDFGLSKPLGRAAAVTSDTVLGTPVAMAPEQIRGQAVGPETDVYALGLLLYRMLCGRPPFAAPTAAALEEQHLGTPPPAPSALAAVSPAVDAVVLRCLAKGPGARFPKAGDVVRALEAALARTADVLEGGLHLCWPLPADADDATFDAVLDALGAARQILERAGLQLEAPTPTSLLAFGPPDAARLRALGAAAAGERLAAEVRVRVATRAQLLRLGDWVG